MKLRSHWPSVTPSVRVLVNYPLHVTLRVEAAFESAIVPKESTKINVNVKRFAIATTTELVGRILLYLTEQSLKWRFNTHRCLASND
jgi:hypothetical protein